MTVWRRIFFAPDQALPQPYRSFHQRSQYSWLDNVIRNPHQIRQGSATNNCQESCPHLILTDRCVRVGPTPALWDLLWIPIEPPPSTSLHHLPLHLCDQPTFPRHQAVPPHTPLHRCTSVPIVPFSTLVILIAARSIRRPCFQQGLVPPLHHSLDHPHQNRPQLPEMCLELPHLLS